jgi:hypothetical protein
MDHSIFPLGKILNHLLPIGCYRASFSCMDSEPFGSLFESLDRQNLWQKDTRAKPLESIGYVSGIAPWLLFATPI